LQGLLNGAEKKASIVFFLGGCTYTEIAALRFIAQHEGLISIFARLTGIGKRILIATTGIINGNTMMHAALDEMSKKPLL
jgi:vacuolar protein sorting-associated protein 33A